MTTIARTLATTILALLAVGLAGPPTAAQEAFTYLVRHASGAYRSGDGPVELDFSADRDPMRVVQGPEVTWVVPRGDSLTRENATMILSRNAPVSPGPGDLMIRGWRPAEVASWDSFSVALSRGGQDREVAGRTAHHYILESYIQRTGAVAGNEQRYEFDADLWILPDVPHSWAPFGFGTRSLPTLAPRLRDTLDERLGELGLVGRAIIRMDFTLLDDGRETDGSRQVTGFEIYEMERTDPPRSPGVVVDRSVMTAVEDGLLEDPAVLCAAVTSDQLPASLGDVPDAARGVIMATINDGCSSPELYFTMLEDQLQADPDGLCARVSGAEDAAALADSVFTVPQKKAFMEMLTEVDRIGFHGELRRYCRGRSAG
ncbi:MAG: hypothetical protein ACN0LA_09220 [Candidatus Longimicrobiales bacterium M2_2A_002]